MLAVLDGIYHAARRFAGELDDDVEVLATYDGGWLTGRPAVVRRAGLVAAGFASAEAWTQLLATLLGVAPAPPGIEVLRRGDVQISLDWHNLTMTTGPVAR